MKKMAAMLKALCIFALVIELCLAHFTLEYPTRTGFNFNLEVDEAPCGTFTPNFSTDNITDFHVDGDTIFVTPILETEGTWLFRATLDVTAAGNWTSLLPAIHQNVLGPFCEPGVTVPSSWAGSMGVVSVVQDAGGALSYQVSTFPLYCCT